VVFTNVLTMILQSFKKLGETSLPKGSVKSHDCFGN